jgi:hypothetical protein
MFKLLGSPLISSLIVLNVFALIFLGGPYFLPLPDIDKFGSRDQSVIDAFGRKPTDSPDVQIAIRRPLFHENRRRPVAPVVAPVQQQATVKPDAPFKLVGILGGRDNNRTAYLQNLNSSETVSAKVGDILEQWTVDTIGTNFVTLVYGDERKILELTDGG